MKILLIFNHAPYDGTDVAWNGLRLADKLLASGCEVRLFLMNEAVDLARDACIPPEGVEQDLTRMLKELVSKGVTLKVCGTCMARCGILKNQPYFKEAQTSTMPELAQWVVDSERVVSF